MFHRTNRRQGIEGASCMGYMDTKESGEHRERRKREENLYSADVQRLVSKRSDIDHTVLPANYTMPAFPS